MFQVKFENDTIVSHNWDRFCKEVDKRIAESLQDSDEKQIFDKTQEIFSKMEETPVQMISTVVGEDQEVVLTLPTREAYKLQEVLDSSGVKWFSYHGGKKTHAEAWVDRD